MTVCIGAICQSGDDQISVVAADRMMTYGSPMNLQTEPPLKKIIPLTDSCVLLFSGSVFDGEEVAKRVKTEIGAANATVHQIAERVSAAYVDLKRKRVEETILQPFLGIGFSEFRALAAQAPASQVLNQVIAMIGQHNLNLELLVSGSDDSGCHLDIIDHPGMLLKVGQTGFATIGSGGLHAAVWLSLSKHTRLASYADTVYNIYEAKKAAEVAPGVGQETDIGVIVGGKFSFLDGPMFELLEKAHKEKPSLADEERTEIEKALESYVTKKADA
jgi:20S proteasome alpha/beta subunit